MTGLRTLRRWTVFKRFGHDSRGVAAVEFGLIATVLFTLMAGAIDLSNSYVVQRDIDRLSAEIAQATSSCNTGDCVAAIIANVQNAKDNLFLGLPNAALGMAIIKRKDDKILVERGSMTYMPPDINTSALTILTNENDQASVNLITYEHRPFLLGFAEKWGFTVMNFRASTIALFVRQSGRVV